VATTSTKEALLEQGALLFARHGVAGVTARQLHQAVGARNESALHYHFGSRDGLVAEILRLHLEAIEARRAALVDAIVAGDRQHDLRALVHALAAPMADDLASTLGRAHLRLVAQLSHPALAYEVPFRRVDAPSGRAVARWLHEALVALPDPIRVERLAALRSQLVGLFGQRAQLLDEHPKTPGTSTELFLQNLLDLLVAGLAAVPSPATNAAAHVS
jgi:AcrR family transcriptional regulator